MNKQEIENYIKKHEAFQAFVKEGCGFIDCIISNVHVRIYKEEVGCQFYYKIKDTENANYKEVVEFMEYAIPTLSRLIEEERERQRRNKGFIDPSFPTT